MSIVWNLLAVVIIAVGLLGAVVPTLPGIPLVFVGIWIIAAVDQYRHLTQGWLIGIAVVGALGLALDLASGALGAKRIGASPRAVCGALIGTLIGFFFGIPGLLLGPFAGAMLGELSSGKSVLRSTHVGVNTWIGLLIGTLLKLMSSLAMLGLCGVAWWWNRVR